MSQVIDKVNDVQLMLKLHAWSQSSSKQVLCDMVTVLWGLVIVDYPTLSN